MRNLKDRLPTIATDKGQPEQFNEQSRNTHAQDRSAASSSRSNANASIEGGLIVALIALFVAFVALGATWHLTNDARSTVADARAEARVAAERADRAAATAALAREYVVTSFYETQRELAKYGLSIEGPLGHHEPVPEEVYRAWDEYVAENVK